jgi:hypothetical protein
MGNLMRFSLVLSLMVAACAASLLAGCDSGGSGASESPPAPETEHVSVSPVTSTGAPASGYRVTARAANASCSPGSEAIGKAYRCFAGNTVYDPCWAEKASTPTVLCVADPWLHTEAQLHVSAPLTPIPSVEGGAGIGEPWGVQLANGQRCVLAQGAHSLFDGKVIDYFCSDTLFLLRGLDMAAHTWTARSVVDKSGTLSAGPSEKIDIAWYGIPAHFR